MNGIPDIDAIEGGEDDDNNGSDDENLTKNGTNQKQLRVLCTPYIQIFKNG